MQDWLKDNFVAAYAALVGTAALVWNIIITHKDRAKIVLSFETQMHIANSPLYKENTDYLVFIVTNRGRRPVVLSTAGYKNFDGKGGVFTDSLFAMKNKTLEETNPTVEFFIEESLIDLEEVEYFFAKDRKQNTYKLYAHSDNWFKKLLKRIRK